MVHRCIGSWNTLTLTYKGKCIIKVCLVTLLLTSLALGLPPSSCTGCRWWTNGGGEGGGAQAVELGPAVSPAPRALRRALARLK